MSVVSGVMGAEAIEEGAELAKEGQDKATGAQMKMFRKTIKLQAPFREQALKAMEDLYAYTQTPFKTSDLYNIALKEGTESINKVTGAAGRFRAGTTGTLLENYASKLMANETQRYDMTRLGILGSLYAGSQVGGAMSAAQTTGTNLSNLAMQGGALQGQYAMLGGQNWQNVSANTMNGVSTYYLGQKAGWWGGGGGSGTTTASSGSGDMGWYDSSKYRLGE